MIIIFSCELKRFSFCVVFGVCKTQKRAVVCVDASTQKAYFFFPSPEHTTAGRLPVATLTAGKSIFRPPARFNSEYRLELRRIQAPADPPSCSRLFWLAHSIQVQKHSIDLENTAFSPSKALDDDAPSTGYKARTCVKGKEPIMTTITLKSPSRCLYGFCCRYDYKLPMISRQVG